ncbi:three-helix bundle dimerization domain-containing protein [Arthrobacter sp. H16F315]|uniref:three-helix bundle dimerization domain-containing protein n=1 Tax=Arthrobacter sp. H16F315 TaxID=2955314 RepID=UPI00406CE46F
MDDAEKRDTIENVTARIIAPRPDAPRSLVARVVAEEYDQLASSRIRTYIPTLIKHRARNRINTELTARHLDEP